MCLRMLRLLLYFVILQFAHCTCPDGFDLIRDGECRGRYTHLPISDSDGAKTAIAKCAEMQGEPVIIHTDEQQAYWTSRYNPFVIGLVCNASSNRWEWVDGSSVDYRPAQESQNAELDGTCNVTCSWYGYSNGDWRKFCGTYNSEKDICCTKQLKQIVAPNDSCERFDDDIEDGVCYQVGEAAENWQDAQMNCRKLGANLASIHNLQENSFVRRLAVSKGAVNGVFLGATISGKGGDLGWIDGSDWDYEHFHPGFPRAGFGDCLAMDTTTSVGDWMNIDCTSKLPVACIRDPITIVQPNATCGLDTWKEGQIITSPGFPFSASMACEFWLTAEAGKRVEIEIILLEANSCCDNLVIYDGYLGGNVMATLTGQVSNVTYTTTTSNIMRVLWEPNGGVNVLGVVMTFRGV